MLKPFHFSRGKLRGFLNPLLSPQPKGYLGRFHNPYINLEFHLRLQQLKMEIEDFKESDFYEKEPQVLEIPENLFRNVIELEEPDKFIEFQLPQDFWEEQDEEDDIEIVDHPNLEDPIYRRYDEEMSSEEDEQTDSAYEDYHTSEDDGEQEHAAAGFLIDYDLINRTNTAWEAFMLETRSSYLLGNHTREWIWFWRRSIQQRVEEHSWNICRGYSQEPRP